MKILSVRLRNLNSLAGDWEINLQNPAFTSSGIFAITGPTGSGKTTILDAICLALYGQTPRLEKISASTNEIMSRHTGECLAEVTFASSEGIFRCTWRQKRAHGKPGGKLQQPEHEIADAASGKILESKIKDVGIKVKSATGMDFEQFTRSMLLAQGGFSAFLEAKPDERAPILEQITGTGIYSDISIKVHERFGKEKTALLMLESEIGMIPVLTTEEQTSLLSEKEMKEAARARLSEEIASLQTIADLCKTKDKLEEELSDQNRELEKLSKTREDASKDLLILMTGKKASSCDSYYKELKSLQEKEQQEIIRLSSIKAQLADANEILSVAVISQKTAEDELLRAEQDLTGERPLIVRTREIDIQIEKAREPIKKISGQITSLEEKRTNLTSELNNLKIKKGKFLAEVEEATQYLSAHCEDAGLITAYSGLHRQILEWKNIREKESSLAKNIGKNEELRISAQANVHQKNLDTEIAETAVREISASINELNSQIATLSEGMDIRKLREIEKNLKTHSENLKELEAIVLTQVTQKSDIKTLNEKIANLKNESAIQQQKKSDLTLQNIRQEELISSLEREITLIARVRDLEEERNHLQNGHPCPLCGSTTHPYVSNNIPESDVTEETLKLARKELKSISTEINSITTTLEVMNRELSRMTEDTLSLQKQIDDAEQIWILKAENLQIAKDCTDRAETVKIARVRTEQECTTTSNRIDSIDVLEKKIRESEIKSNVCKENQTKLIKILKESEFELSGIVTEIARLQKEQTEILQIIKDNQQSLNNALNPFNLLISSDTIDELPIELEKRFTNYSAAEVKKRENDTLLATILPEISSKETSLLETDETIARETVDLKMAGEYLKTLEKERRDVYGDKDPSAEESRLQNVWQKAQNSVSNEVKNFNEKRTVCDTLAGQLQSITRSLEAISIDVDNQSALFLQKILQAGFFDETAYHAALLSPEELTRLETLEADLMKKETALTALVADKKQALKKVRESLNTDKSRETIETELTDALQNLESLQQKIWDIGKKLADDTQRREQMAGTLSQIEYQKKERDRWERLHALIGSADGKKFRVFAQGLTFQFLIDQANRHLHLMTDRYILRPDSDIPLDLAVIDTWQAGEVRSCKNLSGGESFIVSLALALGLSGMASKKVRVDSLFLDEGFGTLDDEALDTALGALSGLHQQGKLIGIISHVPAIKERISTRIVIEKRSGGRSIIKIAH